MNIKNYNKQYIIGVVALSNSITGSRVETVKNALLFLKDNGFKVKIGKTVFNNYGYKTGTIAERIADLEEMFKDKEVNLILNVTGGYNANELLEFIDYDLIRKNSKLFVGYSDITALNLAFYSLADLSTVNGPMLVNFSAYSECFLELFYCLEQKTYEFKNQKYIWENADKNQLSTGEILVLSEKNIQAQGKAIAANLSTFNLLLGTKYMPQLQDKILFLEYDKEEQNALPSLERMLWQLRQNGIFDKLNGLVFGKIEQVVAQEESIFQNIQNILENATKEYRFPVLYNAQFGHFYPSWVIRNGVQIEIKDKDITLLSSL